jgi:hypothetical protein
MSQIGGVLSVDNIQIESTPDVSGTTGLVVDSDRKLYLDNELIGPRTSNVGTLQDDLRISHSIDRDELI